jgi:hypothetical protein
LASENFQQAKRRFEDSKLVRRRAMQAGAPHSARRQFAAVFYTIRPWIASEPRAAPREAIGSIICSLWVTGAEVTECIRSFSRFR